MVGKNFSKYKIYALAKIEEADESVFYMVELSKDWEKLAVLISEEGKIIKVRDISNKRKNNY
jgi:hypothetical protein